jgi:hypothetical protein
MAMVSPLFAAILRGYRILLILYVPVAFRPFLQGFDTKFTTVVARLRIDSVWVLFMMSCREGRQA